MHNPTLPVQKSIGMRKKADPDRSIQEVLATMKERCEFIETLILSNNLNLTKAERELRATRKALQEISSLPRSHDRDSIVRKLKHSQVVLFSKARELRDLADWQRWANLGVQEDLCRKMEALVDVANDAVLARQFKVIITSWRQVSEAPKLQGEKFFTRFKNASDVVYPRYQAYLKAQTEERNQNLVRLRSLVEEAETLVSSNNWSQAIRRVSDLQKEWKVSRPVSKRDQRELANRFRKAIRAFFIRRKEDLRLRKKEWALNLSNKEALCTRIEQLAGTDDLSIASKVVKDAKINWKKIGPVSRSHSNAISQRFRNACECIDEFLAASEREIETTRVAAREALCVELEALLPSGARLDQIPDGLADAVQDLQQRWVQASEIKQPQERILTERFRKISSKIVEVYPEAFHGTSLDPNRQLRRFEKMCERVEEILDRESMEETNASPAEVLAAKWRDALADNLMGVRVDEAAKRRAVLEEIKSLKIKRQKLGALLGKKGTNLDIRFQRTCERLIGQLQLKVKDKKEIKLRVSSVRP